MDNPKSEHLTKREEAAKPAKNKANPSMVQPEVIDGFVAPPDNRDEPTPDKNHPVSRP